MPRYDWQGLLTRWNADLLACPEIGENLPAKVVRSGWLGFPPATQEQIASAEARLGTTFPPSYREFLLATNGWRDTGFFLRQVWPVEQVEWHRTRHQDLIDAWMSGATAGGRSVPDEAYLVYGDRQDWTAFRHEHLQTAPEVSDLWDGVYLLNPQIVTETGEWEAWFYAAWPNGIRRWRSFWELMNEEYRRFLEMWGVPP